MKGKEDVDSVEDLVSIGSETFNRIRIQKKSFRIRAVLDPK
jgi:hypothetical protein